VRISLIYSRVVLVERGTAVPTSILNLVAVYIAKFRYLSREVQLYFKKRCVAHSMNTEPIF
jgi:hypothetical protein